MALTTQQLQAIKTDIAANTATISGGPFNGVQIKDLPNNADANFEIAKWYNGAASPDYFVFKSSVSVDEIMNNGFDWTRVDNATVGKARIWDWMTRLNSFNPSESNIISGINEAWSGVANDTHRLAIFGHCQKLASRVEKLLKASGSGTSITNSGTGPSIMGFEGPINDTQIEQARAS